MPYCSFVMIIKIWLLVFRGWNWYSVRDGRACLRKPWVSGSWDWNLDLLKKVILYKCRRVYRWHQLFRGKSVPYESCSANSSSTLDCICIHTCGIAEPVYKNSGVYAEPWNQPEASLFSLKQALGGCKIRGCLNGHITEKFQKQPCPSSSHPLP